MAIGRPSEYKPEYCQRVIELGRAGKSTMQMACELDVHRDTMYEWAKVHPEFSDNLTRAMQLSQSWWEDAGQENMCKPGFNANAWKVAMSARFRNEYTERKQTELSGPDGKPIEHAMILRDLPEDELTARIEAAMKAMGNG